jgi:hypothetical protein
LSTDGSEGNAYELSSIAWSPDSKKIAAYRVKPGYRRQVHYIESSPEDQLQPKSSSIVDNAYRLQGDLLLVVGELDTNVDPSSTMQVVSQLIKHNKNFDLLVVPGANHPAGRGNDPTGPYGDHKRFDFFVQHLLGVTPPPWNRTNMMSTDTVRQR